VVSRVPNLENYRPLLNIGACVEPRTDLRGSALKDAFYELCAYNLQKI